MLADQIIAGLTSGILYALVALGFTVIYAARDLVHFAQGEVFMLGGFFGYFAFANLGLSFFASLPVAILGTGILGMLLERVVYRRLALQRDQTMLLICTIGVSIFLMNAAIIVWGPTPLPVPKEAVSGGGSIQAGGLTIDALYIWVFALSVAIMAAFTYLFQKTRLGLAMRATAHSPRVASLMGVDVNLTYLFTFALGCGLAGAAGWLLAPLVFVQFNMGQAIGLKAFSAAVIGGMGSVPGAIVGGLLLGVIENIGAGFISSGYKDLIAFVIMIIILLVKPSGLLGQPTVEKV